MARFDYVEAHSTKEVFDALARHGPDARLIAGGTDLLMAVRRRKITPRLLVGILNIPELNGIRANGDGLWMGAATTHHAVAVSPLIQERFPLLAFASGKVGSRQIRNVATVGGNICNAASCADTAPSLLALDAEACILGPGGERRLPLEAFFVGPGRTALAPDELLLGFHLPDTWRGASTAYIKHTWRGALDIMMVGAAVVLALDSVSEVCTGARITLGTAGPTPLRVRQAEEALQGQRVDERLARQVGRIAAAEARPRTSYRATAEYRSTMIEVLVRRAILKALNITKGV